MSAEKTTIFPMETSLKFAVTDEDGRTRGTITYAFPNGKLPTRSDVSDAAREVAVTAEAGGVRLMTRHEWFLHRMHERTGQRVNFALPRLESDEAWHDPATAESHCRWWIGEDHDEDDDYE